MLEMISLFEDKNDTKIIFQIKKPSEYLTWAEPASDARCEKNKWDKYYFGLAH